MGGDGGDGVGVAIRLHGLGEESIPQGLKPRIDMCLKSPGINPRPTCQRRPGEFADGAVPVFLMGLAIFEERTEDVNEFDGIDDFAVELDVSVLDEKGVGGGLEEDVGAGVAKGEFLFHFDAQGVFAVLGFPPGAWEVEGVD